MSPLPIGLAGCKAEGLNMRRLRQRRRQKTLASAATRVRDEEGRQRKTLSLIPRSQFPA